MMELNWDPEKNEWLRLARNVTFEEVAIKIRSGEVLDIVDHPNAGKYPGQRMVIVVVRDYVYAVPYVRTGEVVFLKTIIPSRKLTRQYLRSDEP